MCNAVYVLQGVLLCVHWAKHWIDLGCCIAGKADQLMKPEVSLIIEFCNSIGRDPTPDDTVVRNAVNLLGDICTVVTNVGSLLQQAQSNDWEKLISYCHDSEHLVGDTEWAVNAVTTAVQSAG